jgi:hypothetical protein
MRNQTRSGKRDSARILKILKVVAEDEPQTNESRERNSEYHPCQNYFRVFGKTRDWIGRTIARKTGNVQPLDFSRQRDSSAVTAESSELASYFNGNCRGIKISSVKI